MRRELTKGAERRWSKLNWRGLHAALLTLAFLMVWWTLDNPPLFSGSPLARLHPVVVHLPIAFLLLAPLLVLLSRTRSLHPLGLAVELVFALGLWSSVLALATGGALAGSGAYEAKMLDDHRWWASSLVFAGVLAYLVWTLPRLRELKWVLFFCSSAIVPLVFFAGHTGGSLTHGAGYLSRLVPEEIAELFDLTGGASSRSGDGDFRTTRVFEGLILPILDERCVECHGSARKEAGLDLASVATLMAGGEGGPVIEPGRPDASELIRRIELPKYDEERMPPGDRSALSVGSTELMRWWIAEGADFQIVLGDVDWTLLPSSVRTTLGQLQVSAPPTGPVGLAQIETPDSQVVERLRTLGVEVSPVAQGVNWLEVSFARGRGPLEQTILEGLRPIASNILWMDLSGREVSESGFRVVRDCVNLRRLQLSFSNITDEELEHLSGLRYLETLNLVGTRVGDAGLAHLRPLGRLRTVYLWQSAVTQDGAEKLRRELPRLEVSLGSPRSDGE